MNSLLRIAYFGALLIATWSCGPSVKEMGGPNPNPNEGRATSAPPAPRHDARQDATPARATREREAGRGDAPEISRSAGVPGGIVVLWPRIVLPRGESGNEAATATLAGQVQSQLATLSKGAVSAAKVDVRPAPERVCRRAGCKAISVGALVTRAGKGCAVMALVSRPGTSPARIVPWVGRVRLDRDRSPFRQPPERLVHVDDYVPCEGVSDALIAGKDRVQQAIRAAR